MELLTNLSEGMSWIEILEESNYYLIIVILTNQSLKNEHPFTGCQAGPINIFWKHFCSTKTLWYEWKSDGLVMTPPLMLDDRWMLVLNHQQFFKKHFINISTIPSLECWWSTANHIFKVFSWPSRLSGFILLFCGWNPIFWG